MLATLAELGFVFKQHRVAKSLTQEETARECGLGFSRTAIAHLEQGRRVPNPKQLARLAQVLNVPEGIWESFAGAESAQRHEMEAALTELVGESVTLKMMHVESSQAAEITIRKLFASDLTTTQAFDMLNSILIYYGIRGMQRAFFDRYFSVAAFHSVSTFEKAVRDYQSEAIRLFSTFCRSVQALEQYGIP